ncbi:DNA ligase [Trichinella pseudospiralis]
MNNIYFCARKYFCQCSACHVETSQPNPFPVHLQLFRRELDRRRIVNTCSVVVVVVELDRRQLRLLVELDDCLQGYCCFAG